MRNLCPLCDEPVDDADRDTRPVGTGRGLVVDAHRPCLLRSAVGGIGHLEDHDRWCTVEGDPDGGRSYRQSALEVDAWVDAGKPLRF